MKKDWTEKAYEEYWRNIIGQELADGIAESKDRAEDLLTLSIRHDERERKLKKDEWDMERKLNNLHIITDYIIIKENELDKIRRYNLFKLYRYLRRNK
jgi:hypothetical protein